ncbi:MAG: hypothetical protein ACREGR_03610 [Minisyncoccia bacterium]
MQEDLRDIPAAAAARRSSYRVAFFSELGKVWLAVILIGGLLEVLAYGGTLTSWGTQADSHAGFATAVVAICTGLVLSLIPMIRYRLRLRGINGEIPINHKRRDPIARN